ncbi:MFS transporter [Paenibacillus riograndensis]|uniref:Major facilitator superfamily protein n=1 Tax=Paenibacillus riograndensis SBR5 TaxID=1073571 RepID=A0A0E4CXF7_9BACL|nr:MFS transporter [Paenibacillus riograndensis]CQR56314.1 major facilitator superfamily protein [Paenibacillus riograndensis SBR5]
MATVFLIIIYLAFISLGLPDSMIGAAWPMMRPDFGAPVDAAGLLSMIVVAGTIVSSLASSVVLNKLGTGKVTFISVAVTAVALLGFSYSPSILWLAVLSFPLGLGAGSIDAGLNNYVATHYKAHHMSWLHCFWGVGAMLGPIIMSRYIAAGDSWRQGFLTVSLIQFALVILLFMALPLWKRAEPADQVPDGQIQQEIISPQVPGTGVLRIKGVKLALTTFLFYCGVEATLGLWGSSFLVNVKELSAATAAGWVSLYYGGITVGRLITGFVTFRFNNRQLIRTGILVSLLGALLLVLPLPAIFSLFGFILVGLGSAPIFPCMLHETPARFGKEHSQKIMGYQMAMAYTGGAFLPPMLGWIAARSSFMILPFMLVGYIIVMLISSEKINAVMKNRKEEVSM